MNKRALIPCATAILTVAATLIGPAASAASDQGVATPPPTVTFTTCGQTGRFGPSQAQCDSAYSGQPQAEPDSGFRVEAGIQYWTVPATGRYTVRIAGAGHSDRSWQGGQGIAFTTSVALARGQRLRILVGQEAYCAHEHWSGCGGAGGTFLATEDGNPLVVAGGGGGRGRTWTMGNGRPDAVATEGSGCPTNLWGNCDGPGSNGIGQGGNAWGCGTGGGGFYGDGGSSCWDPFRGGQSFMHGGVGGWSQCGVADGGFGGGGAGYGCWEGGGGGGGGYTGGSGVDAHYWCWNWCYVGRSAGGGGSFAQNEKSEVGFNLGNGWVQLAPTMSMPGLSAVSLRSTAADAVSVSWDPVGLVKVNDWDTQPDSYVVQYTLDGGSTWLDGGAVTTPAASFAGLPCAGTVQVRVAAVWSYGTSDWTMSDPVVVGSDKFRYCPNAPSASAPGQPATVTIVGANPAAKFVSLAVSGATHTIDVGADTIARLTVSPIAAGKTKVSATQVFLDPNTRRWTKQRIDTAVWTFGLKVPRSATVGKPATVTVAYLTPGLSLRITGGDSDAVLTANASGSARGSLMFSRPGIYTVSATGPDSSTIVSGTVNVARGR